MLQACLQLADALEEKAIVLARRGKSVHAAACRLRVAGALFTSYELQKEILPPRQWARKQAKSWRTFIETGLHECARIADVAFPAREFALALRAWRLGLTYDGDGTAITNRGGAQDYPHLRLNIGLALRDLHRYEEARTTLQLAVERNHPDAMVELGILLFSGKGGVEKREEAMGLFRRALAEGREFPGIPDAQPEYPCEYRRDQARTFIRAVQNNGLNVLIAPP